MQLILMIFQQILRPSKTRIQEELDLALNLILLFPRQVNALVIPMRHESDLIAETVILSDTAASA